MRLDEPLDAVFERIAAEDVNQFPVGDDGQLVGMVARDDRLNSLRRRAEISGTGARSPEPTSGTAR